MPGIKSGPGSSGLGKGIGSRDGSTGSGSLGGSLCSEFVVGIGSSNSIRLDDPQSLLFLYALAERAGSASNMLEIERSVPNGR